LARRAYRKDVKASGRQNEPIIKDVKAASRHNEETNVAKEAADPT
jgi:hypothetical protein